MPRYVSDAIVRDVVSVIRIVGLATVSLTLAADFAFAAPTKPEFIRQGDALCAQTQRKLIPLRERAEAAKRLPRARQWAAVVRLWTDQIRIQVDFNKRFRALGLPVGDSAARSIVSGFDRGVVLARRVRDAFAARSTRALPAALSAYLRFTIRLNRRVAAYGFKVCGRS